MKSIKCDQEIGILLNKAKSRILDKNPEAKITDKETLKTVLKYFLGGK